MIENFKDRRLKRLYENKPKSKIDPELIERVEFILGLLDIAKNLNDLSLPTLDLHPLKGDRKGFHSVTVRANWRIVFRLENENIYDVKLEDYH